MRKNNILRIASLLFGVMLFSTAQAQVNTLTGMFDSLASAAVEKLGIGLYEEIRFDDNLYSKPRGKETSSVIFETGLSLDITKKHAGNGDLGIGGKIGYQLYLKETSEKNSFTWSISPRIGGEYGDGYLKWRVGLMSTHNIEKMGNGDTRYARHYVNNLTLGAEYSRHPRWGVLGTATYTWDLYPQREFRNYTKHTYDLGLAPYYKLTEKVKVGPRVSWMRTEYQNHRTNDDSNTVRVNGFVDYRMSQAFSASLEAGAEKKYYDGKTKGTNKDRSWRPDASLSVHYLPFRNLGFLWNATWEGGDSTSTRGTTDSKMSTLTMNWQASRKVLVSQSAGVRWENQREGDTDTREWFYRIRMSYEYTKKMSFYVAYEYDDVDYRYMGQKDYDENVVRLGARWGF